MLIAQTRAQRSQRDRERPMSTTIKKINDALKRNGYKGEIVRGDGYHYFVGEDFDHAFSTSVDVMYTSHLSLDRWLWRASTTAQTLPTR